MCVFLKKCWVMKNLEDKSEFIYYKKKQTIVLNTWEKDQIIEVISGVIKYYTISLPGEEILTDIAISGDFVCLREQNVHLHEEYAIAVVDTKLKIHSAKQEHNPVWKRYNNYLTERTSRFRHRLINSCSSTAMYRLDYIYKLYDVEIKDASENTHRLIHLLTYKELGNMAGVTRQTAKKYTTQLQHSHHTIE